jgi:phosphoglycolate phosphatase-like HAD superfamily hydrolase
MLDRTIVQEMMRRAGAPETLIRRAMPEIVRHAQHIYAHSSPETLRHRVCPGVRGFLRRLTRRQMPLGLVTGNLSAIGWRKMELAGLREHFRFGVFAEMAHDRAGLVRIALRDARRNGWLTRGGTVWLVGDHENDVRAAHANRIRSLAVATGLSQRDQLAACRPDLLVEDLRVMKIEMLFGVNGNG